MDLFTNTENFCFLPCSASNTLPTHQRSGSYPPQPGQEAPLYDLYDPSGVRMHTISTSHVRSNDLRPTVSPQRQLVSQPSPQHMSQQHMSPQHMSPQHMSPQQRQHLSPQHSQRESLSPQRNPLAAAQMPQQLEEQFMSPQNVSEQFVSPQKASGQFSAPPPSAYQPDEQLIQPQSKQGNYVPPENKPKRPSTGQDPDVTPSGLTKQEINEFIQVMEQSSPPVDLEKLEVKPSFETAKSSSQPTNSQSSIQPMSQPISQTAPRLESNPPIDISQLESTMEPRKRVTSPFPTDQHSPSPSKSVHFSNSTLPAGTSSPFQNNTPGTQTLPSTTSAPRNPGGTTSHAAPASMPLYAVVQRTPKQSAHATTARDSDPMYATINDAG